jgi:23S rRNA (adenine2503-C2)-methyltransferase
MNVQRHLKVPTGDILVVQGQKGSLELLSLGDYGKDANLKCAALGLDRDIEKVEHQALLPLEEKWVITVSTQYGCSMGCTFCDVPLVGPGKNATEKDLIKKDCVNPHPYHTANECATAEMMEAWESQEAQK